MVGGAIYTNFPIGWQEVSMSKVHVVIYSRPGCHLCDDAKAVILSSGCADRIELEEINIESDEELLKKYKYDIPVIVINGVDTFMHRVSADEFVTRIRSTI